MDRTGRKCHGGCPQAHRPHDWTGPNRKLYRLGNASSVLERDISFRGIHADRDTVVFEEQMRATLPGGKPYENDYCFVFVLAGDRIKQVREYMDTRAGR